MKSRVLTSILYLLLSVGYSYAHASKKIVLTTQVWPPYQIYNDTILDGSAVVAVKNILEKMQVPYEIRVYPWERAQLMVRHGIAQGFFLASQNKERDKYATLSEILFPQKWNWYLLKDNPLNPTDGDFKRRSCVLVRFGSNMRHWLNANEYQVIGSFKSTESLIDALLAKRCDAMLASELVVNKRLKEMNLSPDMFKTYLHRSRPLGVYWSKQFLAENPDFLTRFNQYVKEYRDSEESLLSDE